MAEEGNSSNVVAIFAIVILAGLAVAFAMFILPRMQGAPAQNDQPSINVDVQLPSGDGAPEGGEGAGN